MNPQEERQVRAWVAPWRENAKVLDELRVQELRALTEKEAGRLFAAMAFDTETIWISRERANAAGLIEQQRFLCAAMSIQRVIGAAHETSAMPRKNWIKHLPDGFRILVQRRTERGRITEFAVVLVHEGICITRYDTAHGFAHRDVPGRKSALIAKERYDKLSVKEVFEHAINDFTENCRRHLDFFLQN